MLKMSIQGACCVRGSRLALALAESRESKQRVASGVAQRLALALATRDIPRGRAREAKILVDRPRLPSLPSG